MQLPQMARAPSLIPGNLVYGPAVTSSGGPKRCLAVYSWRVVPRLPMPSKFRQQATQAVMTFMLCHTLDPDRLTTQPPILKFTPSLA